MAEQSPDPISAELRDAFEQAIAQYGDRRGGEREPQVSFKGQFFPISSLCEFVSKYEGRMPDDHWHRLAAVMPGGEELPIDLSYQSAARFLGQLISDRQAQFDRCDRG
jgi:hypothetical protein